MSAPDRADTAAGPIGALVIASLLFGVTFVVVKDAVAVYPPLSFVAWRFLVGGAMLAVLAVPRGRVLWRDGLVAGGDRDAGRRRRGLGVLWAAFALQTVGLTTTGASNSALITGLYVVLTPFVVAASRRRPPRPWVVIGTVIAFVGLVLLAFDDTFRLGRGDFLTVLCALGFAIHIAFLAVAAPRHAIVPFTAVQLLTVGVLGFVPAVIVETAPLPTGSVLATIVLTGVGVSALAFLLQVWAQTRITPERTAVILTLEPVFGLLAGVILLGERLDLRRWAGALLILVAIQIVVALGTSPDELQAEAASPAA